MQSVTIRINEFEINIDNEIYEAFKKKFEFDSDREALQAIFYLGFVVIKKDFEDEGKENKA